jgi:general secretion pathway protein K
MNVKRPDEDEGSHGFVLIPIIAVVMVFAMVSAGIAARSRILVLQESNRIATAKLQAQADGIARLAAASLMQDNPEIVANGLWNQCSKGETRVAVSLTDQDMLLDLNGAPLEMLEDVLAVTGIASADIKALSNEMIDYRDPDDMAQPLYGAERVEYQRAGLAWGPRNGYFADPSELGQLPGAKPELQTLLSPLLTIYNGRAAIDPEIVFRMFGQTAEIRKKLEKWTVKSRNERFSIVVSASVKGRATVSRLAVISRADPGKQPVFVKWSRPGLDMDAAVQVSSDTKKQSAKICDWMAAAGFDVAATASAAATGK